MGGGGVGPAPVEGVVPGDAGVRDRAPGLLPAEQGEARRDVLVRGLRQAALHLGGEVQQWTGWPSFYEPVSGAVDGFDPGLSYTLYDRKCKEIRCHNCGGHLGHVFSDGAIWGVPTGQRYCMNGVALRFEEKRPGA